MTSDSNEMELKIAKNGGKILMTLEHRATMALDDDYIDADFNGKSVLFRLKDNNLPKGHKLIVRTKMMILTVTFRVVAKGADSQVHILRAGKEDQDLAVEERVKSIRKELSKEHQEAMDGLDAKVSSLAEQYILQEVHTRGVSIAEPTGGVRARQDFLVLRAKKLIRVGKERLLEVSLQERKGSTFTVDYFEAAISQGGSKRKLDVDFRCKGMSVLPGKTNTCHVSLGSIKKEKGRALLDLTVMAEDGKRSVSLEGVDIL